MLVVVLEWPGSQKCVLKADLDTKENNPVDVVTQELKTMIEEEAVGEKLTVMIKRMSWKEYGALPEWEGW